MNRPFLITIASKTAGTERFAKSLKVIEHQIEHYSIQFQPPIPEFKPYKVYDTPYVGNLKRFDYLPLLDDNRFHIFSDTDDVIFQRELPDFERLQQEIVVANENVLHKDSYWKPFIERNEWFTPLMNKPVYNGGLFSMRGNIFRKLVKFMKENLKWVKEEDQPQSDQLLFNMFFLKNPYYEVYDRLDIFCPLYSNFEKRSVKVRKGLFYLNDGHVPVAIHANGNTKEGLEDGRKLNKINLDK